jgi:hypothetical protein
LELRLSKSAAQQSSSPGASPQPPAPSAPIEPVSTTNSPANGAGHIKLTVNAMTTNAWCTFVRGPNSSMMEERMRLSKNGKVSFTYFLLNSDNTRAERTNVSKGTWSLKDNVLTISIIGGKPVAATVSMYEAKSHRRSSTITERLFRAHFRNEEQPVVYRNCN